MDSSETATGSSPPESSSRDHGASEAITEASPPDDSWLPPPPDDPVEGNPGSGSRLEWRQSSLADESPILAPGRHLFDTHPEGGEGRQPLPEVPGFVILDECGRGGMGVVYLAEQVDLGRRVALKFLKPELAGSASQRTRLLVEATALARLQHPNIVQIFSTGTHEGRAYIAQEYVDGGSLDKKLTRQPATARHAAEMVATLARAVQHAHRQRIIHRDLKPSNVLVTADGTPKISDFGLAKHSDLDGGPNQTQSGAILGSPSYMAPEQSLGKKGTIGPLADIYALGAILYEMLTSRPPFLAASTLETLEQVRTADPVPPRQLQPGLPRDIETICLKCLSKDPARRYQAAAALADDLDRFLQGHPIHARPVSRAERLVKWVKRRPATAASLAVAALAASALIVGGLIYQNLLRAALTRAEKSAELARQQEQKADARYRVARDTLSKMLERLHNRELRQTPRLKELEREQMDDVLGFYREVARDRQNPNPAVRFDVAQAGLQSAIAEYTLGRAAEGREQINHAVALLDGLVSEDPSRPEYRLELARAYRVRGTSGDDPNRPQRKAGGPVPLPPDLEHSRELLEKLLAKDPGNRTYRTELAVTCNNLGTALHYGGDKLGRAESFFRRAIDLRRSVLDRAPSTKDVPVRVALATSLQNLAVLVQQGKHGEQAPPLYAESRQLLEDALKLEPQWDEAALALGFTLKHWGEFLSYDRRSRQEAEELLTEAIKQFAPLLAREPDWDQARIGLLQSHGVLAQFREIQGRYADAASQFEQVVSLAGPPQNEHYQFYVALNRAKAGQHREAWNLVRKLRPSLAKRPALHHFHLAVVCSQCLGALEKDAKLTAQERALLGSTYGATGVEILRHALELLPPDERAAWRPSQSGDSDLAPLGRRPEFQALLSELARAKTTSGQPARIPP